MPVIDKEFFFQQIYNSNRFKQLECFLKEREAEIRKDPFPCIEKLNRDLAMTEACLEAIKLIIYKLRCPDFGEIMPCMLPEPIDIERKSYTALNEIEQVIEQYKLAKAP